MGERAETLPDNGKLPGIDLLDALEARIGLLVESHRELKGTVAELKGELRERERRLRDLSKKLETSDRLRDDARRRIRGLIEEVDRISEVATDDARDARA